MQTLTLSRRELQLLRTLWDEPEWTLDGLGAALGVTARTVAHHLTAILTKMGVTSRMAAVKRGLELGLLDAPRPHEHRLRHVCQDCGAVFE